MKPWKLEEGLKLVRALQGRTKDFGYHITLGGGVLNTGQSDKDLDLYFLPYISSDIKEDTDGLLEWLESLWGESQRIGQYPEPDEDEPQVRRPTFAETYRSIVVDEDTPVQDPSQWVVRTVTANPTPGRTLGVPKKLTVSRYRHKLKFSRAGEDRIDVFIL